MRRLAKQLDVAPGALYWHFPSKQDLLGAIAEALISQIESPQEDLEKFSVELFTSLTSLPSGAEITLAAAASHSLTTDPSVLLPPEVWHYILGAAMDYQDRQEAAQRLSLPEPAPIDIRPAVRALLQLHH